VTPAARPWLARLLGVEREEQTPVALGFMLFFLVFASYFMLRPVRETMGIAGGVENLQWLFTGTFVAMLAVMPLFGWLASRARRRHILPWTYVFFATNLIGFGIALQIDPENVTTARTFYIWISVFNFIAISVAWSVLADLFSISQAKRTFALMAAGASGGGLVGPLLGAALVGSIGHAGLLFLSALLLATAIFAAAALQRWRDRNPAAGAQGEAREKSLGGSPFAGATAVFRSPYLIGIGLFVVLLSSVTTFLYFEQAKLMAEAFPDRTDQTRVFGIIDSIVQALAILTQLFFTGRIAQRLGVVILLTAVPLVVAGGFLALAVAPTFAVLVIVMIVRRAGEYGLVRPGREMLFTVVPTEDKYKAKNFIDTVVYRGADAVSSWAKVLVDALAQQPALAALTGCAIALVWAGQGGYLAKRQREMEARKG
jgi:AAA family ATP:ADP antiporter